MYCIDIIYLIPFIISFRLPHFIMVDIYTLFTFYYILLLEIKGRNLAFRHLYQSYLS